MLRAAPSVFCAPPGGARRPERGLTPAADHAARRRGPRNRRRVRDRESAGGAGTGGSVIRHAAAPGAVGPLAVAVVETALLAALVARPGGADRPPAAGLAAGLGAVGVAAVAGRADGESLAARAAASRAESRWVHGVGARGAVSDWTFRRGRVTNAPTGRLCRSAGRSRGSGGLDRTLTLLPRSPRQSSGQAAPRVETYVRGIPASLAHLPLPGKGSPGQSPNTACGNAQGPACFLLDGGLLFSGRPSVTGAAKRCLARPC